MSGSPMLHLTRGALAAILAGSLAAFDLQAAATAIQPQVMQRHSRGECRALLRLCQAGDAVICDSKAKWSEHVKPAQMEDPDGSTSFTDSLMAIQRGRASDSYLYSSQQ